MSPHCSRALMLLPARAKAGRAARIWEHRDFQPLLVPSLALRHGALPSGGIDQPGEDVAAWW